MDGVIVGSVSPGPSADKQRVTGRTALPVPTTKVVLWSDVSEAVRRTPIGNHFAARASDVLNRFCTSLQWPASELKLIWLLVP